MLIVIPSIDIKDNRTVRVVQGIPELDVPEYGSDPIEMAGILRAENAKLIHIVDYDAFAGDKAKNLSIIKEMCSSFVTPVEYAGGIRTPDDAKRLFDVGVARLAVSTVALEDREALEDLLTEFTPFRIVVAIDVADELVMIRAKRTMTKLKPVDFAQTLKQSGVLRFIVNDVRRNGMLSGPNLDLVKSIAVATECKVTLAGGIYNKDQLIAVQELLPHGVDSAIIGRALYENRFPCQKLWRLAEKDITY
jgi:phosphoribosylformimino-5-aminoimidazole carboxamide ribotide isomerase